jgi:hypothetical protein
MVAENMDAEPEVGQSYEGTSGAIEAEMSRIAEHIAHLAEEGITQTGYRLLSKLGSDLGDDMRKIKLHTGLKLSEFIAAVLVIATRSKIRRNMAPEYLRFIARA